MKTWKMNLEFKLFRQPSQIKDEKKIFYYWRGPDRGGAWEQVVPPA